jgi:hypothetical protein
VAACTSDCAPSSWSEAAALAGDRTRPERSVDGLAGAARFADVGRLRWDRSGGRLVAYDGAVRAIGPDGAVSTLVTAVELAACSLGESPMDVDVDGGVSWFCAGTSSLARLESDGRVVAFPVAWSAERLVRTLASEPSGGVVLGWSKRVCPDTDGPCWVAGLSRLDRTGGLTDVVTTVPRSDLGGMTDLMVMDDGGALVVDPDAATIHVFDLASGAERLLVDAQGAVIEPGGRHLARDAAGRILVGGRVFDVSGRVVGTYPTTDAGDALALAGADDDLVRGVCEGAGALRRCEIVVQRAVCAP